MSEKDKERDVKRRKVILDIRRLYRKKEPLYTRHVIRYYCYLFGRGCRCFGNWQRAVEAAGLDYSTIRKWRARRVFRTKKEVVAAIMDRHSQGLPLNYKSLEEGENQDKPLLKAAKRLFGKNSWKKALCAAGFDPNTIYLKDKKRTPESVIKEIRSLKHKGVRLNAINIKKTKRALYNSGCNYFGDWGPAVEAANINYLGECLVWSYKSWLRSLTSDQRKKIEQVAFKLAVVRNNIHQKGDKDVKGRIKIRTL